jgi:selenocysteine lyase/cysteine desulfurase
MGLYKYFVNTPYILCTHLVFRIIYIKAYNYLFIIYAGGDNMSVLEYYFDEYRRSTIGYNQNFVTCYGMKEMIYADWAASGRLYYPIENKLSYTFGPFVGNTHSESNVTGCTMTSAYNLAREIIKRHVNAGSEDVLILTGYGMTSAVNKLQRIMGLKIPEKFKSRILLKNDERPLVIVTHMEHHSNHISWREALCDVACVMPRADGSIDLDNLEAILKKSGDRRMIIGAFTACSNVTGIITPCHEMAKLMHKYGGLCFMDFSTCAPYIEIDMHPKDPMEKFDAIYFSPHKFLGGPGTSGVLVFDSKLYNNTIPDHPGGGTVQWTNPWGEQKYFDNIEQREDGGTPGFLQAIKTALCIELKEKMGIDNMQKREEELTSMLLSGLLQIDGLHVLAENIKNRLGVISFYMEDIHYNLMVKLLNDYYGIQTRGGCACAGTYGHYLLNIDREQSRKIIDRIAAGDLSTKPGWVRISLHPMMTDREIDFILYAVKNGIKNINAFKNDYYYKPETNEYENHYYKTKPEHCSEKWFEL